MNADSVNSWANWFLIASLVVGVFSTWAIVVTGNIKERNLKLELSRANERAAKSEERAAELELASKQLEIAGLPRRINQAVSIDPLKPFAGTYVRIQIAPDFEPRVLGAGLVVALNSAGWKIEILPDVGRGSAFGFSDGVQIITKQFEKDDSSQSKVAVAANVLEKYLRTAMWPKMEGLIEENLSISRMEINGNSVGLRVGEIAISVGSNPGPMAIHLRRSIKERDKLLPEKVKEEMQKTRGE